MPYRLTLDVPYRFVVRPAFERALHAVDLVTDTANQVYHDRGAGIIILMPSCIDSRWQQHVVPVEQIQRQAADWRAAYRGVGRDATRAHFLGRALPAGRSLTAIEIQVAAAIIAVEASLYLRWVARTSFNLDRDEAWAIHIQCADDEYTRDGDYLYAQWDRYAIRLDTRGELVMFRYPNRADLTQPPREIARWHSGVVAPVRSALTLAALPLPPLGILVLVMVSGSGSFVQSTSSSTSRQLVSSKLIPLRNDAENIGTEQNPNWSLCRPSALNLAVNVRYNPIVAFERVRYAEQGTLTEKPFEIPLIQPQTPIHTPLVAYTHVQSATTTLQYLDGDTWSDWTTEQVPLQARMRLNLTTADTRYTPICVGYFLRCAPLVAERDTTPVDADRILYLELTKDSWAREEGIAECLIEATTTRLIATRGDTTYRLAYREQDEPWQTISEGFAEVESIEPIGGLREPLPFRVKFQLRGMWSRFTEIYQMSQTAFDGISLAQAFNKLLEGCGFEPIAMPPNALEQIRLPVAAQGDTGSGWRYAPRVGQSGEEILRTLLLFATATGNDWRLRWDYDTGRWLLEVLPDGTPEWQLYPAGAGNFLQRRWRYNSLLLYPRPPEANLVYVEGATAPNKEGERLVVVLVNEDSLVNPNSLDYLGRVKLVRLQAEDIDEIDKLQLLAERIYVMSARHHMEAEATLPLPNIFPAQVLELLQPPRKISIYDTAAEQILFSGYIKQATLTAHGGENSRTELKLNLTTIPLLDPRE